MGLTIKIKIKRQVRRYDALGVLLMCLLADLNGALIE